MKYAIEVEGLTKHYKDFTLDNVSFRVPAGSIVGFIGENGAGKTTSIKAILDLIQRDAGTVRIPGRASGGGCEPDDAADIPLLGFRQVFQLLQGIRASREERGQGILQRHEGKAVHWGGPFSPGTADYSG